MAVNPSDVTDPARRRLLGIAENSQAASGDMFTDKDLPDIDTPAQFDNGDGDGGEGGGDNIRQSILSGVNAQFETNMAGIQENALQTRRFNVGSTGDQELRAVRIARNEGIAQLGQHELTERQQLLDSLTPLALAETEGEQTRKNIVSQGTEDRLSIADRGTEDRLSIADQGTEDRLTVAAQGETGVANIKAQGVENRLIQQKDIDAGIATEIAAAASRLAEIKAGGEEQVDAIEAQAVADRALQAQIAKSESEITGMNLQLQRDLAAGVVGGDADPSIYDALDFIETLSDEQLADMVGLARDDIPEDGLSNDDRMNLARQLLENSPDVIPRETLDAKGARVQRDVAKQYATIEDRKTAVLEKDQMARESIQWAQHSMNQISMQHGMRMTEAQISGIWQAYGPEEMEDFKTAFGPNAGGSKMGDETYNARYDMDGNGTVDFLDMIGFSKAASEGGVPTLAMQQMRESARQFDVSDKSQMSLLKEQIKETGRQFDLTHEQTRKLALHTLHTNTEIASLQLNVEHVKTLVDLLIDAPGALSIEDGAAIISAAMDMSDIESVLNVHEGSNFGAQNFAMEVRNVQDPQVLDWMQDPATWDPERIDTNAIDNNQDLADWYETMDFDNDGIVTMSDYAIFLANGGSIKLGGEEEQGPSGKPAGDFEGGGESSVPNDEDGDGIIDVTDDTEITPEVIQTLVNQGASRNGIKIMLSDRKMPDYVIEATLNSFFDADGNIL